MSDVIKSIWINAEPETVFDYFTDADKMARWCGRSAELDAVPGGVYRLDMGATGVIEGRFLRVEAPTFVSIEIDGPRGSEAPPSVLEVSIAPEAGGSRVDVRHAGLEAPFSLMAGRGLDHHLARLSVAATGGAPGSDPLCARQTQSLI